MITTNYRTVWADVTLNTSPHQIWHRITPPNITPINVDEGAINSAHATIAAKNKELSTTQARHNDLCKQLEAASEALRNISIRVALGEANETERTKAERQVTALTQEIERLEGTQNGAISSLTLQNDVIEELQARKQQALNKARQAEYQRISEAVRNDLKALMVQAAQCTEIAERIGVQLLALQQHGFTPTLRLDRNITNKAAVPDYTALTSIYFNEFEGQLFPTGTAQRP